VHLNIVEYIILHNIYIYIFMELVQNKMFKPPPGLLAALPFQVHLLYYYIISFIFHQLDVYLLHFHRCKRDLCKNNKFYFSSTRRLPAALPCAAEYFRSLDSSLPAASAVCVCVCKCVSKKKHIHTHIIHVDIHTYM